MFYLRHALMRTCKSDKKACHSVAWEIGFSFQLAHLCDNGKNKQWSWWEQQAFCTVSYKKEAIKLSAFDWGFDILFYHKGIRFNRWWRDFSWDEKNSNDWQIK